MKLIKLNIDANQYKVMNDAGELSAMIFEATQPLTIVPHTSIWYTFFPSDYFSIYYGDANCVGMCRI